MKTILKYSLILAVAATMASCNKPSKEADKAPQTSTKTENVKVMELQSRKIARTVEYTATLQAWEEIHMVPASPGRIEKIHVDVGSRVSQGAVLVEMDRTQLHQAELQLRNLETDYRRLDTLRMAGSVAKQQFDQIKTQYDITKTNVDFLKQNTRLVAPFSGIISGKYFESGEMYTGAPNTQVGKAAIVTLVQMDRLKVIVAVTERYFPLIKTGMVANVVSDIYPEQTFTGKVAKIYPTIDPGTRTFNIELQVANPGTKLRPGMFCRVSLDLDQVEATVLPSIAVLKMQGSNDRYLFIEVDGKAVRIPVTTGRRYDDMIEVFSDQLKTGDHVIVSGQARLLDGVKVTVVQ
jgi:membrane fusion protein, multidrug efflux system